MRYETPPGLEVGVKLVRSLFDEKVSPFQAVRIMTGAQIPSGCDAVVMLEPDSCQYEEAGKYMELKRSFKTGDNISSR